MANNNPAVTCTNIQKSFHVGGNTVQALRDINLTIERGEFMMLVGPSGCGKTTLLSIIASVLTADTGECNVLGNALSQMRESEKLDFRANHVGFIFQQFNLLPSLTIAQNVAVPMIIKGSYQSEALQHAHRLLEEVGLGDRIHDRPQKLSGGQQQRVAIARALVHEPDILLCDEPTSALDHQTGIKILELMKQMNQRRNTTVIIVTHDERVFPFAERIAHMNDGVVDNIYIPEKRQG